MESFIHRRDLPLRGPWSLAEGAEEPVKMSPGSSLIAVARPNQTRPLPLSHVDVLRPPATAISPASRIRLPNGYLASLMIIVMAGCPSVSPPPDTSRLPTWRLAPTPTVSFDGSESGLIKGFGRLTGVRRLPNGNFFVTDAQAREAWVLTATGLLSTRAARRGKGPGELEYAGPPIRVRGDSLAVVDWELRRILLFDRSGRHAATRGFPMESSDGYLEPIGLISSDRFVGKKVGFKRPTAVGERMRRRETVVHGRFRSFEQDTIAVVKGAEVIGGVWKEGGESLVAEYNLPFGETTIVAVDGEHVLVGETSQSQVVVYSQGGQAVASLRWGSQRDKVTDDDRRRMIARESTAMTAVPGTRLEEIQSYVESWRSIGSSTTHQSFTGILVADDGSVWVEFGQRPWLPERSFLVFGANRAMAALLTVPRSFRPCQADSTAVVGIWREEGGADEVRQYAIVR